MGTRGGLRRGWIALVVVPELAACSSLLAIDADRYVVDGASDAGASLPPWACLGAKGQDLDPSQSVDLTVLVMDALQPSTSAGAIDGGSDLDTVTGAWLSGVAVRSCAVRDVSCSAGSSPVLTNEAGVASFQLAQDFLGFFAMQRDDLVPATLYPGSFLSGQSVASFPAYDISPAGLRDLAASATSQDIALDPNGSLGHTLVTIYDCNDHQAPGVAVAYSATGPQAVPFYFADGLPSTTAAKTDGYGLAGAVNVPAGSLTVTATLPGTNALVGATTFVVRPGAITFAWIRARTQ